MPNALLACFFQERNWLTEFDFAGRPDSTAEIVFAAWFNLSKYQRHQLDAGFCDSFAMSCEQVSRILANLIRHCCYRP